MNWREENSKQKEKKKNVFILMVSSVCAKLEPTCYTYFYFQCRKIKHWMVHEYETGKCECARIVNKCTVASIYISLRSFVSHSFQVQLVSTLLHRHFSHLRLFHLWHVKAIEGLNAYISKYASTLRTPMRDMSQRYYYLLLFQLIYVFLCFIFPTHTHKRTDGWNMYA